MTRLAELYRPSLALLTDLYQLTMAFGYFKTGAVRRDASFSLFFRHHPFNGGFTIACGLATALDFLEQFRFELEDLDYLSTLVGNDGEPLFDDHFLDYLRQLRLECEVHAVPEGTVVFPYEPLIRVTGPLLQAQLLETALLNIVNFQSLVATKAARICAAAQGDPVLEFGLRRAQGIDGGLTASRAAYIGGAEATSNVLAGRLYGIPVKGTHAHSWVMAFEDEEEAFVAYAAALPGNCVFLVDTYDTIEGVRNAIRVGQDLRQRGFEMVGVRLDSGDLAELSKQARRMLDEAGFENAVIVGSNDLDEHAITELKRRGATIGVWGVGTRLVTGGDQAALGGVYKLGAVEDDEGKWQPRIKLSERSIKTSIPGIQQVRRFFRDGSMVGDLIFSDLIGEPAAPRGETLRGDRIDFGSTEALEFEDLLQPVIRSGELVAKLPSLTDIRQRAIRQCNLLPDSITRIAEPKPYPVGLELRLAEQRRQLMVQSHST